MPSVTTLGMDLGVSGMAEGHQIFVSVIAALSQWFDVMHLIRLDESAFSLAPLTKRVCIHVSVVDAFPCPPISSLDSWVSAVLFVPQICQFSMFLTESAVRQLGTARVRSRGVSVFSASLYLPWA